MQMELIETFLDLAQSRSFHRTAERLGVTQSTVSARLAALESALEARLFDRSRAGTSLTPEGKRFEPHARNLRHEWNEARAHIQLPQGVGHLLRIGIQNDLSALYLGAWITAFRADFDQVTLFVEPDYSNQMCADLLAGILDVAVMFSPKPHPDLSFDTVGEVRYVMVSNTAQNLGDVRAEDFVFAHFSPAFQERHRQVTPHLAHAPISVGQSSSVTSILETRGGSGYVLEAQARAFCASGAFRLVADAPVLPQPVYSASHIRHRITPMHRRFTQIIRNGLSPHITPAINAKTAPSTPVLGDA